MKKSSKSSLKKRSLDITLQHKDEATYKFSKENLLHLAKKRAGAERVNFDSVKNSFWVHTHTGITMLFT